MTDKKIQVILNNWRSEPFQSVGNCVVASHNIGFKIRLCSQLNKIGFSELKQKQVHKWIREQEIRTSSTPSPQIGII